MGLAPGEKALMYALGGIARGGATRGGYTSVQPFIALGGQQIGTRPPTGPPYYRDQVLADGASHYWRLEETSGTTAADAVATGPAPGTISGGVTGGQVSGLADGSIAMAFNGTTGKIVTAALVTAPLVVTIEAWIKAAVRTETHRPLFSNRTAPPVANQIYLGLIGGNVFAGSHPTAGFRGVRQVEDGLWHHVVAVYDGALVRLYVDGLLDASGALSRTGSSGVGAAGIGFDPFSANYGAATIDDVAIYPSALTAAQIATHYGKRFIVQPTTARVLMASLTITDNLEQAPNTCAFMTTGMVPALGAPLVITLGTINSLTRLFGGVVLKADQTYLAEAPANVAYRVDAIDFTWLLNRRLVNARYTNQSGTAIALDLIAKFTQGFTTFGIQTGLGTLDEISFTNTTLSDALSQLAKRLGATWYVDYGGRAATTYGDVHLFTESESQVVPPTALTLTHPTLRHLSRTRDLSQIVTRVFYEGGGANAQATCGVGETIIPIETTAWYNANGGMVSAGPQRLTYARIFDGGGGTLVGPGVQPAASPQLTVVGGVGVTLGLHWYVVTFLTAVGESLPGPGNAIIVTGATAAPDTAPVVTGALGGTNYPVPGAYQYAVSYVTPSGETLPSAVTPYTQTAIAGPLPQFTAAIANRFDGTGIGYQAFPGWVPGATLAIYFTWSTQIDPGVETPLSLASNAIVLRDAHDFNTSLTPGYLCQVEITVPTSSDPRVKYIHLWSSLNGGALQYFVPKFGAFGNSTSGSSYYSSQLLGAAPNQGSPTGLGTAGGGNLGLTLPLGPTGITRRRLYRTPVNGSQLKLVMDIGDNVTRNVTDTLADASLGANAPTVATATAAQVALSGIPVGAASVTARKIYRTVAGGAAPYKLLATLADNVTTTYLDALADASLGANAPSGDTSGLKQPDGQVLAGASTLLVAGAAAFRVTGGWALLPGGQNVRYTGISGNSLIGIPPSGIGAVLATINYNATVTAAPALEGIPASGVGAVVIVVKSGDPINLVVQVDDAPAQAQLAAVIGGDGVQEAYLQDNRISETEARARAAAALTLRRTVEETIHYESRDRLTQSGTTIAVNLPLPTNMAGSYKVQQVTISGFEIPTLPPVRTVEASSNRFTFEDLLRLARTVTPPGA